MFIHPQRGLTLVELLVTLSIVAILLGMGAPSFAALQKNAVRRTAINDYWHSIFLARSEAIKRNSVVVLCKSSDGLRCNNTSGNWADGWMVFDNLDHDMPAQVDAGEPVLRQYGARPGISIRIPNSNRRQSFSFRPVAQSSVNGTLVFCDDRGSAEARAIIISHTGRPRHSTRDASNQPLTCPAP